MYSKCSLPCAPRGPGTVVHLLFGSALLLQGSLKHGSTGGKHASPSELVSQFTPLHSQEYNFRDVASGTQRLSGDMLVEHSSF